VGLATTDSVVRVSYRSGHAKVCVGDRLLHVERRDDRDRSYSCPIELVTAALGS
jgi:hypothetical protein